MSLEVFGDGGDDEDLMDLAARYDYTLGEDGKWRGPSGGDPRHEPGMTDHQMWEYIWDRRESDAEDMMYAGND